MRMTRDRFKAVLVAVALAIVPIELAAQEEVLVTVGPNVRALRALQEPLQMFNFASNDIIEQVTSPDAQALQMLNAAASGAASELRAAIDLLAVYENLQCDADRAMLKPLLDDRLPLYSRLLGIHVESATLPLSTPNAITQQATGKKALKLRDELLAAKNKLDEIIASLK